MDESEQADAVAVPPPPGDVPHSADAEPAAESETARLRRMLDTAKQSESDARRAVGLLNSIISLLPIGVTVQAEDGAVVLANEMAAQLSGASGGSGVAAQA